MILEPSEVRSLYRRTASFYDLALVPYRLLGLTVHRRHAVEALALAPGDTVVDLCCGTGANFPLLQEAVGPGGRVVGVDLTDAMLDRARRRVERAGWRNVTLLEVDVVRFEPPPETRGLLATFALEMVPDHDVVVRRAAEVLGEGGRMALLGLKHPAGWPEWLVRLAVWLNRPFGVDREYASIRPWESLRRHLTEVEYREFLGGAGYVCVGEAA